MAGRIVINVDKELAGKVKEKYPGKSWTEILRLLLDEPPINSIDAPYATKEELKELKDKFLKVLSNIFTSNNLKNEWISHAVFTPSSLQPHAYWVSRCLPANLTGESRGTHAYLTRSSRLPHYVTYLSPTGYVFNSLLMSIFLRYLRE